MTRLLLAATLPFLLSSPSGATQSCAGIVQGVNEWELVQNNRMIEGFSLFDVEDWSASGGFQMLAITDKAPAGVKLQMEFRQGLRGRVLETIDLPLRTWERDSKLRIAFDRYPEDVFARHPRSIFVLRLVSADGRVFCESSHAVVDDEP